MILLEEDYIALKEILDKYNRLISAAIQEDSTLESWDVWEPVYNKVFSNECSQRIRKILPSFRPYIPDTTYGEDVCAFWRSFQEVMCKGCLIK